MYCRVNSDWLWANYPPAIRFASMVVVSGSDEDQAEGNVLVPEVIQVRNSPVLEVGIAAISMNSHIHLCDEIHQAFFGHFSAASSN